MRNELNVEGEADRGAGVPHIIKIEILTKGVHIYVSIFAYTCLSLSFCLPASLLTASRRGRPLEGRLTDQWEY